MSWSTAPTLPQRKYGPGWATTAAPSGRAHGPGWFALLEKVAPLSSEGTLSVSMFGGAPRIFEFTGSGTLSAIVAPIKTVSAAFGATAALTASRRETKAVTAAFSGSTDGMRVTVNEGLSAIITGGGTLTDGLSATIRGGTFDGLRADIRPIIDGLYGEIVKV